MYISNPSFASRQNTLLHVASAASEGGGAEVGGAEGSAEGGTGSVGGKGCGGEAEGGGGGENGGLGDGSRRRREPQSVQSVPRSHQLPKAPQPPS